MRRLLQLTAVLVVGAALVGAASAEAAEHVAKKTPTAGFYEGKVIHYFDFGPIKLKAGNKLAPIWAVTNGPAGQHNIVDTVPGRADYSPLWQVSMVTWQTSATPVFCAPPRTSRRPSGRVTSPSRRRQRS